MRSWDRAAGKRTSSALAPLGVIDRYDVDTARAVRGADVVLVAVPLGAMSAVFGSIRDHLEADTIVTDVGSSKQSVVADAARELGPAGDALRARNTPSRGPSTAGSAPRRRGSFAPGGSSLTPTIDTAPEPCARVRAMWEAVGAEVLETDPRAP